MALCTLAAPCDEPEDVSSLTIWRAMPGPAASARVGCACGCPWARLFRAGALAFEGLFVTWAAAPPPAVLDDSTEGDGARSAAVLDDRSAEPLPQPAMSTATATAAAPPPMRACQVN